MISANWIFFREICLKILSSMVLVVTAMLLLQGSLNQLKLRALIAEATSSRHQIAASAIEAAVVKAEGLGFAIDQMTGLQDLIERKRAEDDSIETIAIVSPIGLPLLSSGTMDLSHSETESVLRRVLGSQERLTRYDAGDDLFTGRQLFDSSGALMGAVVIVAPTEAYLSDAQHSFEAMHGSYLKIFGVSLVILVPLVLFQFAGIRHAFNALNPDNLARKARAKPEQAPASEIVNLIDRGDAQFARAHQKLDDIVKPEVAS